MLQASLYPNHNNLSRRLSCLKVFMSGFLSEQPNSNPHYLNRLIKLLNHFISIEPPKKIKGYERHHIIPKSWKPEWDKISENHLKIPIKAHYVIHHLMWKAFPKNYAMMNAFIRIRYRLGNRLTLKTFKILRLEFNIYQSAKVRKTNSQRIENGTHNFLGSENNKSRIANGSHNFLNGEFQKQTSLKRIADSSHNFLGPYNNKKQLDNGTHPSQIKKTCPHCNKTCSLNMFGRWHGVKCRMSA